MKKIKSKSLGNANLYIILDGIFNVAFEQNQKPKNLLLPVNYFILENDLNYYLIDAGLGEFSYPGFTRSGKTPYVPIAEIIKELNLHKKTFSGVLLSHMHLDHTGGLKDLIATYKVPIYVQKIEWEFRFGHPKNNTQQNLFLDSIKPFMNLITETTGKIGNCLKYSLTAGHSPGHQVIEFATEIKSIYPGDLIPTPAHLIRNDIPVYNLDQSTAGEQKAFWIERLIADQLAVVFSHSPHSQGSILEKKGENLYIKN